MKPKKRVFGWVELVFDIVYLLAAAGIGLLSLRLGDALVAAAAWVLALGDAFHLVPRIMAIVTEDEPRFARAMRIGKAVTSITMTVFYLLLWQIGIRLSESAPLWAGLAIMLAALRILLCLLPQNRWLDSAPPRRWAIYRNIPFVLLGAAVAVLFAQQGGAMPLAILLSFVFYLPVVLFVHRNPKIGMLMLPKSCAYIWMLLMLSPLSWPLF